MLVTVAISAREEVPVEPEFSLSEVATRAALVVDFIRVTVGRWCGLPVAQ